MLARSLSGAAKAGEVIGVEDVFSTWLYTGNGSTQTITNGIDLAGEGGLVFLGHRASTSFGDLDRAIHDTLRGAQYALYSSTATYSFLDSNSLSSFGSTGFTLATGNTRYNESNRTYVSWAFRKTQKFFDLLTYVGTGVNRTISHNLGSVPGCIIIKKASSAGADQNWQVYHRSLANTEYLVLNSTAAKATGTTRWNSTTPTSTEFSLGTDASVNASGATYVAYLFAHDAGGFGDAGDQSVVKCGSYTGNGSATGPVIDLGWEPQWVMVKNATGTGVHWYITDNMRGFTVTGQQLLAANLADAELSGFDLIRPTSTGFSIVTTNPNYNTSGATYIYIAIRRGPMKTPTDATEVFKAYKSPSSTFSGTIPTGFAPDFGLDLQTTAVADKGVRTRLLGERYLSSTSTAAEATPGFYTWDGIGGQAVVTASYTGTPIYYMFRRAPGFFDVVAYTGTGGTLNVTHNLGVTPELMIIKQRSAIRNWIVYSAGVSAPTTSILRLNTTGAVITGVTTHWNSTAPTSTVFTVGNDTDVNASAGTYIAYLFASCPGVSKVGSYTGTAATQQIDCGFTAGARFVLIKRTDSTGDWYVWDSARGIISGNDPYLLLNSTAAEVTSTDYIDPLSTGFEISSTAPAAINASGGSFIFLAIA